MPHYLKTLDGEKHLIGAVEAPIPCFRCGLCCIYHRPRLTTNDLNTLAEQLKVSNEDLQNRYVESISPGYVLRHGKNGCVFLIHDENGTRATCSIYPFRPEACRNWIPSLSRRECQEGLRKLGKHSEIILLSEIYQSEDETKELYSTIREGTKID